MWIRASTRVLAAGWLISAGAFAQLPREARPSEDARASLTMSVAFEYRPAFRYGEEAWDLYAYLDGDLLVWVPRGGQMDPSPEVRFGRSIGPGPHVLRLTTENHERRSGGGWFHEARVSPVEVFFHLADEGDVELALRLIENREVFKKEDGPLAVVISQAGKTLQNIEKAAASIATWPALCEEIEANLDPDRAKVPRKIRRELAECVRWPSLWKSSEGEVPDRETVRNLLERYDYQPRTYKRR